MEEFISLSFLTYLLYFGETYLYAFLRTNKSRGLAHL
jgi:hypothetical protein